MGFLSQPPSTLESFGVLVAHKDADETKVSDTTVADDTELILNLEANSNYIIRMSIYYDRDGGVGGGNPFLLCRLNGAGGLTFNSIVYNMDRQNANDGVLLEDMTVLENTSFSAADDAPRSILIAGAIETVNAGTIAFAWAQASSQTKPLIIKRNSSMTAMKA